MAAVAPATAPPTPVAHLCSVWSRRATSTASDALATCPPYAHAISLVCAPSQGFGKSLKTKAEDLIEGKVTAPVIRAMMALGETGGTTSQRWLWGQYSLPSDQRDVAGMVELIEGTGAFETCIDEANAMVEHSWAKLDALVPASFAKVCLRAFGWFVCKVRDY